MAEQQTGIINYDPVTTNSLLEKMYESRNAFPFDTEAAAESERGITSGAVYAALNELKGATTLNKGYWPDLNTLQTGIPVAEEGSIAYVGGNAPYAVYRWASGGWTDTGQTFTPEVSPGNFYTKQEVDGMRQTLEASVADAAVGANYAVLEYTTSVAVTRMQVPMEVRKAGYMIGYDPGTGFTKEVYIGTSTDNAEWQKDGNWKKELPEQDVAALAEQAQSSAGAAAGSASAASGSAQAAQTAAEEAAGLVQAAQDSIAATETAAQDAITSMQEATGQAVSEAQAAAGNANAAADEANAAAQSANAAAESIGEKQGAGKPLANGSEVFNDLENNSVEGAAYAHAEGKHVYAWGDSSHAEGSGGAIRESANLTPDSAKEAVEAAWNVNQTATLPAGQQFMMAWGENSHAEGKDNLVTGKNSHAGGHANKVTGANSMVSGHQNVADGDCNLVEGAYNTVGKKLSEPSSAEDQWDGSCNVVAGRRHTVKGKGNTVTGMTNSAPVGTAVTGNDNLVHGSANVAGDGNFAMSSMKDADSGASVNTVSGSRNFAFRADVEGDDNVVISPISNNEAKGTGNVIVKGTVVKEGDDPDAPLSVNTGNIVIGGYVYVPEGGSAGSNVVIDGTVNSPSSPANAHHNVVIKGTAYGGSNVVIGNAAKAGSGGASVQNAVAIGNGVAAASFAVAIGRGTAEGEYSAAMGYEARSTGRYAVSLGNGNEAAGESSFSTGKGNVARGDQSVAAGFQSYALGNYAIALGGGAVAVTEEEIAEAEAAADNVYEGLYSFYIDKWQEQDDSFHMAYGKGSVVMGKNCLALRENSFACGYGLVSVNDDEFVVGRCNSVTLDNPDQLFTVGNGSITQRNTAFCVYEDGDAELAGTLSQSSDIRLKDNVKDIEVKGSLRLREWDWKDGRGHSWGFVADEAETLYPEMVSMNANGYKSLDYNAALCAKLAELEKRIEKLEKEAEK